MNDSKKEGSGLGGQIFAGGAAILKTRKAIMWTAKADCPHCQGHGLLRTGSGFPLIHMGVTFQPLRSVCGCVESEGE